MNYLFGSCQMNHLFGSCQMNNLFGSCQMNHLFGSCQMNHLFVSCQMNHLLGSCQMNHLFVSCQMNHLFGSCQINKCSGIHVHLSLICKTNNFDMILTRIIPIIKVIFTLACVMISFDIFDFYTPVWKNGTYYGNTCCWRRREHLSAQ